MAVNLKSVAARLVVALILYGFFESKVKAGPESPDSLLGRILGNFMPGGGYAFWRLYSLDPDACFLQLQSLCVL